MKVAGAYDPSDTAAWLKLRLSGFGGSDAAAIMGADSWRGPYDVWNDRVNPDTTPRYSGEAAYWGTVLERVVAQEFAERKKVEWETNVGVSEENVVYQHETRPYMLATIDRLVWANFEKSPRGILEVKTRSAYLLKEWESGPPEKVWWQVQHYLAVTGFEESWVAVLIGGQRYHDYSVARDNEAIARLESACESLWDRVQRKDPPPLDGSKAQRDMLDAVEPVAGTSVRIREMDPVLADLADYMSIKQQIKSLESDLEGAKARIQKSFGDAEHLVNSGGERLASWTVRESERFDAKEFQRVNPELAAEFTVRKKYRTLTVKGAE